MTDRQTTRLDACECCGEPATRKDADGVPLCEADWLDLLAAWDGMSDEEKNLKGGVE